MARIGSRYRGRHRKPTTTGNAIAKTALAGAVVSAPLVTAGQAQAAPDNVWDRVAQCESGGNWGISTGNGFQGGLQFTQSTWRSFGGAQFASTANRASREQQIVIAEKVLAGQGWNAWPVCSRKAGARGSSATQRTISVAVKAPAKANTPPKGDRPANKPTTPTVPSPRRSIEDATPAVPAVLPPAPAPLLAAPAPLLAAATQPAPQAPAPALTALPQLRQPAPAASAPATGPGVLLAASPPALEHAAPAPVAAPAPAAPLAAPQAAAPAQAEAPLAEAPKPAEAPAPAAPTGPKHAAPEPAQAAPAQPGPAHAAPAHAAPAPAQAAPAAGRTYQVRPGD
ncbi:MAG TPA: transglycosylase family protein, partial [Pseudonocardia sp.]|nr:transglycosylase family protein [Pseudonocardia sp.]